jgi:hypothetical protein
MDWRSGVFTTAKTNEYDSREIEAIPINHVEVLEYANETDYVAPKDCIIYQVELGDPASDDGVVLSNGKVLLGLMAGGYLVLKGEAVKLKGSFIVVK